ncbi:hypothetical protein Tco_0854975 [Tanacetum coccineum]
MMSSESLFREHPARELFKSESIKPMVTRKVVKSKFVLVFVEAAKQPDRISAHTQCYDMGSDGYAYPVYDMFGIVDPNMQNEVSLIPLSRGSFDVLVGMDRLSKRKFGIVCHEKVVRIPLEGDEILRVHGERAQRVVKTLMNTKTRGYHTNQSLFRREHQCRLLRRGAWSSFEVSVRINEEGEVTYLRFIANFSKVVKPHTSPTERNQNMYLGLVAVDGSDGTERGYQGPCLGEVDCNVAMMGELQGAEVDKPMAVPAIEEVAEPIDEAKEQMIA